MNPIRTFLTESSEESESGGFKGDTVKVIIQNGEYVLILRRANSQGGGGKWDLPGGGIEEGESAIDAAIRETKEETNIDIEKPKKFKTVKFKDATSGTDTKFQIFKVKTKELDSYLNPAKWNGNAPEHTELKWLRYQDELERIPMIEELKKEVLTMLKKRKT